MRKASVERKTKETEVAVEIVIDGSGKSSISTSVPFLDHMLELFAQHGLFDLTVRAKGDIQVDYHHTVEDIGISLGECLKKALGDCKGIRRYGEATVPMDESLSTVVLDICNRPAWYMTPRRSLRVQSAPSMWSWLRSFSARWRRTAAWPCTSKPPMVKMPTIS